MPPSSPTVTVTTVTCSAPLQLLLDRWRVPEFTQCSATDSGTQYCFSPTDAGMRFLRYFRHFISSQTPCVTTSTGCWCDNVSSIQAVYASKQVPSSYGTIVPGRHMHSRIVYSQSLTSPLIRSSAHHDLTIPRNRLARYGSRGFATSGPSLWNSLPLTIRDSTLTFAGFCSRLKTELYNRAYGGHTAPSW